jgi:nucleotide-binding universal stress UspA family protein
MDRETGDPAERIIAAAQDGDADALALTTHARGGVASLLMGSVARGWSGEPGGRCFSSAPE